MEPMNQKNKKADKPEIVEETREAKRARIRGNPMLQKRWDHHLQRMDNAVGYDPRVVAKLKEFWSENWDLFPETIRKSFLDAVVQAYQTNTNVRHISSHRLWKVAVTENALDLDWGVWMVLRITYYDVNINEQDEKRLGQRLVFQKGAATKRMKERYPDIDILSTDFPGTFPGRPLSWPELGTKRQPAKPKETQEEQPSAVAPVEQTTQARKGTEPPAGKTQLASSLGDGKPRTRLPSEVRLTRITLQRKRKAGADWGDMEDEPGDDDHPTGVNKRLRRDIARDDAPSLVSRGQQLPDSLLNAPATMSYEEFERSVNDWGHRYGQPNAGPLNTRDIKREVSSVEASGFQQTPLTQPLRMFPGVKREVDHSSALPSTETSDAKQAPLAERFVQPPRPLIAQVKSEACHSPVLPGIEDRGMQQTPTTNQPIQPARPLTTRVESVVFNPPGLLDTTSGDDSANQTLVELMEETKRDIDLLRARVEAMGAILPQVQETRLHRQTEAAGARRRKIASLGLRGLVAMVASVVVIKLMEEGII